MAVMHLLVKFGADIFIQSTVIYILQIQDGGRRHLGFSGYVNLTIPACSQCGIWNMYKCWFKHLLWSLWSTHLSFGHSFDDVTWINFRFRFLVTWSSPHGCDASFHKILCIYIYLIRSYWHFPEIKDCGRRHLGFIGSHGTSHEASFVARTSCKNFVMIG